MKSKKIMSITTTEENVRLAIYDGEIPLGEAGAKLLEIALAHHQLNLSTMRAIQHNGYVVREILIELTTPWPVRWAKYIYKTVRKKYIETRDKIQVLMEDEQS